MCAVSGGFLTNHRVSIAENCASLLVVGCDPLTEALSLGNQQVK